MRPLRSLLFVPVLLLAAACSPTAQLAPPDGFAQVDPGEAYDYRATSAAGVVIGVRAERNDPKGNLDFWTAALDHKLKKAGYSAVDDKPAKVSSASGLTGKRQRYQISKNGRGHEYWVTVFVTESEVIVVEAAGDEAYFDASTKKQIEAATLTVKAS